VNGKILFRGSVGVKDLREFIVKWFKRATIVLVGACEIIYEGRASSKAGKATRLIIIKEDGTVLVHESRGREPINWQPNSTITVELVDDVMTLKAVRLKPKEVLKINMSLTDEVEALVVSLGSGKFEISGTEEELVVYLARNPTLIGEGVELVSREVITPYGRIDLIFRDRLGSLILVEVKRGVADVDAAFQLKRYVDYYKSLGIDEVVGVLVAPEATPNARKILSQYGFKLKNINLSDVR